MRDKKRIRPFLRAFESLWDECPDLRFGQLIYMLKPKAPKDMFYLEEKDWLSIIREKREELAEVKEQLTKHENQNPTQILYRCTECNMMANVKFFECPICGEKFSRVQTKYYSVNDGECY